MEQDDTRVEFEVQVWRKESPLDLLPQWYPIMSGIDNEAKATKYRNFLIDDRGYRSDNVMVIKYTWERTKTEIWSYK